MMRVLVFAILLSLSVVALGSNAFVYEGALTDNSDQPITNKLVKIKVEIIGGTDCSMWEQATPVTTDANGSFQIDLTNDSEELKDIFSNEPVAATCAGGTGPYTPSSGDERALKVTIVTIDSDGDNDLGDETDINVALTPNQIVSAVPYAISSQVAEVAEVAKSVAFSDVVGAPADEDSLGALNCSDGQVASWNNAAGQWECSAQGAMPAADVKTAYESNTDTNAFTNAYQTQLDNFATNAVTAVGGSKNDSGTGTTDLWSADKINSVISGLSDNDSLAALSCADGKVVKRTAGVWTCGDDADTNTQLNEAAVDAFVANNGYITGYTETDPTVESFAKSSLPTCGANEVLKSNGTNLSCVTDQNTGSSDETTLTPGANIAVDGSTGRMFKVTANQDIVFDNPTNLDAGAIYRFVVVIDGTGGHTVSFGSNYKSESAIPTGSSSTEGLIPGATGTVIGNMDYYGTQYKAFDGTTTYNQSQAAYLTAGNPNNSYIGKDWGSVKYFITGYAIWGSSDYGFNNPANGGVTIKLQGSDDNATWTDLHNSGPVSDGGGANYYYTSGIDTSTAYRYHRVYVTSNGGDGDKRVSEVQFTGYYSALLGANSTSVYTFYSDGTNLFLIGSAVNMN
jgi:hypothetical protein